MSKPYDASTKYLMEKRLPDWLPLSGRQTSSPVEIVDTDVSTITAAADKALLIRDADPWLLHVELQTRWDDALPKRIHHYNGLLEYRHNVLVHSMVLVLRQKADSPGLTGGYQCGFPGEDPYRIFRFQVVRVWQLPLERLINAGLGLLPLVPLTDEAAGNLPQVIHRIEERIQQEADTQEAANLWTATDVLMGLRYSREMINQLLKGVGTMEDSVTYQEIVEKGMAKGLEKGQIQASRQMLLIQGTDRFGSPNAEIKARLEAITDYHKLQALGTRLLHVSTWEELLEEV